MNMSEKLKTVKQEIFKNRWPFLGIFLISFLALFAVFQADFSYYDDLGRVAFGYRGWSNFSRYLSSFFSIFLHGDPYLSDISPWPQILALLIMGLAGVILLKIFTKKEKFTFLNVVSVVPLAINPYFLECLSYKYDAPYMAFSVLVSIIPLLFAKKKTPIYGLSIFLCTLMMCMTYQASSGIFLMLVLFYALYEWMNKKSFKECLIWGIKSVLFYIGSLLVFKIFFMQTSDTYVTNTIFSLRDLPLGVLQNFKEYYHLFLTDFKVEWLVLFAFLSLSFLLGVLRESKRSKVKTFFLTLFVLFGSLLLCFGIYPAFTAPLFSPRAMYGIGVFLTLLMTLCANFKKNWFGKICVCLLCYLFCVFALTYGNALQEQKRYTDYRINLVVNDLNELEVSAGIGERKLKIVGNIGYAPAIKNMPDDYQMLKRLIPLTFGGENVWYRAAFFYYSDLRGITDASLEEFPDDLSILKDTMFHTIYGNVEYIIVALK